MSRHEYTPPEWPARFSFAVGFDIALDTFFALVMDTSISRDEAGVIVAIGGTPPHFSDLDNLMRVVNARIKDRLPPVRLTRELCRELMKEKNAKTPVVNSIGITPVGQGALDAAPTPPARPCSHRVS